MIRLFLEKVKRVNGQLSLELLIFSAVTVILMGGFVLWAGSFLNLSVRDFNKNLAFSMAEAGIEYYRWHLAHASTDYEDGTGQPGPYIHNYYSKNGDLIGTFILEITPPPNGSTIVTVRSTGKVAADASIEKIIEVRLGIPSFAKYAWALDSDVTFGSAAEVFGAIHSNAGIHFDGIAYNLVSSALTSYNDPDHTGSDEWAVHTHRSSTDPLPPTALPSRSDVFMVGRETGVPTLDFAQITQDLAAIKDIASSTGYYFPSSTARGYDGVFATSGIMSVYRVTATTTPGSGCSASTAGWGTWSIQSETLVATRTIPTSGSIFFEDNIWVRGQISNRRVTIGAGRFPDNQATRANATINNDLRYTNYDGSDAIGLIAQNNINIGLSSEDDLRIDGALIAQNGRFGRYSYSSSGCGSSRSRTQLTTYGMIASAQRSGVYYSGTNGYQNRDYIYDTNLLYGPPPDFPLTTDQYAILSWDEVK
ncbi:MAG: hypothetical protein AAB691_04000 [Patescibacteria group bacterium]